MEPPAPLLVLPVLPLDAALELDGVPLVDVELVAPPLPVEVELVADIAPPAPPPPLVLLLVALEPEPEPEDPALLASWPPVAELDDLEHAAVARTRSARRR